MKKGKTFTTIETHEVVDGATGELDRMETASTYTFQNGEPPFVKMYLESILYLKDLPKSHNPILHSILLRMPYAEFSQNIAINKVIKQEIAQQVGCSLASVNNAITDFVKGEVLLRVGLGTYQVNPYLFGKGDWKNIAELRLHVTFNPEGKTIMTEVVKSNKKKPVAIDGQLQMGLDEKVS